MFAINNVKSGDLIVDTQRVRLVISKEHANDYVIITFVSVSIDSPMLEKQSFIDVNTCPDTCITKCNEQS